MQVCRLFTTPIHRNYGATCRRRNGRDDRVCGFLSVCSSALALLHLPCRQSASLQKNRICMRLQSRRRWQQKRQHQRAQIDGKMVRITRAQSVLLADNGSIIAMEN